MARPLVRAVFALLVLATIAAFFVTQQLKSEFPLVIRFAAKPKHFSPNGDRYRDSTEVGFDLSEPARSRSRSWTARATRSAASWTTAGWPGTPKHRFRWDGRDDDGNRVPDGDLPDARRAARRGPRDRLAQADPRGPQAAAA